MAKYISKLLERKEIAEETMEFHFSKPEGFNYKPGKHIEITLINPPETDEEGNSRVFSLVSAPYEPNLIVATRMRDSAFKRVLKTMPLESEVYIEGPYGSLILHSDSSKPAVFIAGGIGITPFMSMIRYATKENLPHKIFLFYSNRRPEDTAYLEELQQKEKENPNFRLIATMTQTENSKLPWHGETGYISEAMIKKYVEDITRPIYYLAGPPGMVSAMREILVKMGVIEDNIRTEEFGGY
jgi:ferredoxin-NADP reductase